MDNLTHTLVGVALAQVAQPAEATRGQRRLFLAAGVAAANLPDLDLAYVGITPAPLGYLLHHRGHTHTLLGLVAQGALLALACRLVPAARRATGGSGRRLGTLLAAGLLTHILLDYGNSYGVHPFHPFDSRWYYGDAVFILEPWLWLLLGVPVAWNLGRIARVALLALVGALPVLMFGVGVILAGPVMCLVLAGVVVALLTRPLAFRARAATALALAASFIGALFGLSAAARAQAQAQVGPRARGTIVDTILNPNPGDPLCWMAMAIEKSEAEGDYVFHRGALSLVPRWRPATSCASHRFARGDRTAGAGADAWEPPLRQPLAELRGLAARDCRVRAWMQFGRAPVVADGRIYDRRFDEAGRGNFTDMTLGPEGGAECPSHLTSWAMPRADLLNGPR